MGRYFKFEVGLIQFENQATIKEGENHKNK